MRRVAGIAQDVTLAGRHAAGKLDPRDEFHFCRRMALQLLCPSYSVVVREGKNSDTGGLPSLSELEGRVRSVGRRGMHVKINFVWHNDTPPFSTCFILYIMHMQ